MTHHVWLVGWPTAVGGANTEAFHTITLWRRHGCRVSVIPTWEASEPVRTRLETLGCDVVEVLPEDIGGVPGIRGAIVVSFSNERFIREAHRFKALGCRIVWASCMVHLLDSERPHYLEHGTFDAHVFQSRYQRDKQVPHLRGCPDYRVNGYEFTADTAVLIPGAFEVAEFPFAPLPHKPGERFIIGRLSRDAPEKFPMARTGEWNLWEQVRRIPHPTTIRVMGWSPRVQEFIGRPPAFAEVLPPGAETAAEFLGKCHAMVPGFACCPENWPRVGLEAMACGSPIVAQNRGGWREMLAGGVGVLVESVDEQAYQVARMAYDENYRMVIAIAARLRIEGICEQSLWDKWDALFTRLKCTKPLSA